MDRWQNYAGTRTFEKRLPHLLSTVNVQIRSHTLTHDSKSRTARLRNSEKTVREMARSPQPVLLILCAYYAHLCFDGHEPLSPLSGMMSPSLSLTDQA